MALTDFSHYIYDIYVESFQVIAVSLVLPDNPVKTAKKKNAANLWENLAKGGR